MISEGVMTHITYPVQAMATKLDQNMANQVTLNVTKLYETL